MYSYRVKKYIGAYLAALGGVAAVVVGGGIGENTAVIRERIFENMEWCGIVLDRHRNADVIDHEGTITGPESKLPVWIIPTQEGRMLAREVADAQ
jgi:acetate kinase